MDEFIYSVLVSVDMWGSKVENIKTNYSIRIEKYKIKSETNSNYVLWGETHRIKKSNCELIKEGILRNGGKYIGFVVWTRDKDKIRLYKEMLIQKITDTINIYRNELKILESAMNGEIEVSFRDNSLDEYKRYEGKIAEDMF